MNSRMNITDLDMATRRDIVRDAEITVTGRGMRYGCGCVTPDTNRPEIIELCRYHEGFDDGVRGCVDMTAKGDTVKMLRETFCVAQTALGFYPHDIDNHVAQLGRLADICDEHRPLGPDGKHDVGRCTPTCGCVDKGGERWNRRR